MKLVACILAGALTLATLQLHAEACEATVDMADSLDFHKMHVECDNDPVFTYNPGRGDAPKDNAAAVTTYPQNKVQTGAADEQNSVGQSRVSATRVLEAGDNSGKTFNIREPFTLSGGPESALQGLFVQMASYCPGGWSKIAEWAEPAEAGYFLHYQLRCAD